MRRPVEATADIEQEYSEDAYHLVGVPSKDSLESVKSSPIEKVSEFEDYQPQSSCSESRSFMSASGSTS